jgi:acetyl esterase
MKVHHVKSTYTVKTSPRYLLVFVLLVIAQLHAHARFQQDTIPAEIVFKKIDTLSLYLKVYKPAGFQSGKKYPAIVFFFGGGWNGGSTKQFRKQAIYFASRGMVTVLADYRVASRNRTTPFEAVADAKSAIRYLRKNASGLNIDPNRIAAAGGSAGGHLAASADLTKLDEKTEDLTVSSRPNALVLFNPVFNNGPGEYGYERIGDRYREISPFHNIVKGAAPTVVFFGTKDKLVSVETAQAYKSKMIELGNRCELYLYPDQVHGFFNSGEYYDKTVKATDVFLKSLGYIQGTGAVGN